ncbi:uncharacterized protein LOC125487229 [Rhincodon typus]|uniref:uncharacterized protein LOC125487229 n=1 Tax=Rhincodon typus TaxID=259920 RepID=UPI002030A885|nr:uncharacterized protein LOC125487229 [Rhincodon typus]
MDLDVIGDGVQKVCSEDWNKEEKEQSNIKSVTQIFNETRNSQLELTQMQSNMAQMFTEIKNSKSDFKMDRSQMKDKITQMFGEISNSQTDIKTKLSRMKDNIAVRLGELRNLQVDCKMDLSHLRQDMTEMFTNVSNSQDHTKLELSQMKANITGISKEMRNSHNGIMTQLSQLTNVTRMSEDARRSQADFRMNVPEMKSNKKYGLREFEAESKNEPMEEETVTVQEINSVVEAIGLQTCLGAQREREDLMERRHRDHKQLKKKVTLQEKP